MKTKFSSILTLLLAFVVQITFAQQQTVRGTVTDEDGLPLPGVNVIIQGTSTGVQTNFDGEYAIEASMGDVLVFSFIGMETAEYTVGTNNEIDVTLSADAAQLDEVVVTALGIEREKKEIAYQTEQVDNEILNLSQPTTATEGLVGKVAGMAVNIQNNGVNPQTQINLRGFRSISQSSTPLYVIDGAIATAGAFNDLNPNDIQDMNILKGATAAALYGSQAANGAIIINTKRGVFNDRFTVGVTSTSTFQEVAYMPDFQDEYGTGWQGSYETIENTNWGPRFDGVVRQVGPTFEDGTYQELPYSAVEDNLKDFYDTGITLQNTVYASGGGETSRFYASIGDQTTQGIVPGDEYERQTFRVNASKKLGDLEITLNSTYFRDNTSVVGDDIGSQERPLYWFVLNTSNNIPLSNYRDWQNDLYASPNGYYNGYYQNPYWAVDTNRDNDETERLVSNLQASWDINEWLNLTGRLGVNSTTGLGHEWRAEQDYTTAYTRPDPVSSFVTESQYRSLQYTSDILLTGELDLSDDFSLRAILGASNFTSKYNFQSVRANNLSIPGFYDISNGTGALVGSVNEENERYYGVYGDFTFGFRDYLYLDISGRNDWTSTLPFEDNANSYFYPAAGLSFVATDAIPAIKGEALNYLKLTANGSIVYNDLDPYQTNEIFIQPGPGQSAYDDLTFPYGNINGFTVANTAVDPDIKQEKVSSLEIGANFGFLNNRITLNASYFNTKIEDLITRTSTAPSAGSYTLATNLGELKNEGYEFSLGARLFQSNDFSWNVDANFTHFETTVVDIDPNNPDATEISIASYGSYGIYAIEGMAFPQVKALAYERDPQGRIVIDPATGYPQQADAQKAFGKTTPDYTVGLVNTFRYKGLSLAATFDYRTGHVFYSQLADFMEFTGRSQESVSANRQDFIIPNTVYENENGEYVENTNIPVNGGLQTYWTDQYNVIKENYVRDATALKLREVALNYRVPESLFQNTAISKISLGLVGRNLVTWLPEENRFSDPEFNNSFANSNTQGVSGYLQSPPTRSYGFNVNIEF
ncbi:SusC/RagA family TonB-linked outer membrane protein [Zunongwangia sp. F363]|uniref:SusC/RagA family TonB-linked outer membrane protein n=1 Tax=Autumnicola tepida TaxID=3075595 RepID=A0ABU3C7K4_9FLAO|nr:SusC/RagA family TonB-linked outer membrane protein [Zunongwangia sp. F363]MDT0642323.1 SusC/RagA family TonB-linked outer membrane protein [Zunongwangia sp. F363]